METIDKSSLSKVTGGAECFIRVLEGSLAGSAVGSLIGPEGSLAGLGVGAVAAYKLDPACQRK